MVTVGARASQNGREMGRLSRLPRPLQRSVIGGGVLVAVGMLAACVPPGYGTYSPAAGRAASPAEALAVSTAVRTSALTSAVPNRLYRVEAVRLGVRTAGFAFATIDPLTPQLGGAAVELRATVHPGQAATWQVVDVGSAHVGCSAPVAVRREFALHC